MRRTYYDCEEGLTHVLISVPGSRLQYICDEEAEVITDAPDGATDAPDETTAEPTEATAAPTTASGLTDCPRGDYQSSNYIYSSL